MEHVVTLSILWTAILLVVGVLMLKVGSSAEERD
jgi:hypothetical protein